MEKMKHKERGKYNWKILDTRIERQHLMRVAITVKDDECDQFEGEYIREGWL